MHESIGGMRGYKTVATKFRGDSFGAVSLLYAAPRATAAFAETDVELFTLRRQTFKAILMKDRAHHLDEYISFMDKVSDLQSLTVPEKKAVSMALLECTYDKGATVI